MRINQNLKSFLPSLLIFLLTAGSVVSQPPTFVDVTEEAGIHFKHNSGATEHKHIIETMGSGGIFFDYDTDGDVDLYFVDSGNVPSEKQQASGNVLYRNEGDGRFTDVTEISGTGDTGYGMAASAGDIDNDGHPDLYVANFRQDKLYRNNGDGTFTDITEAAGIDNTLWSIGAVYLDFDVDGDLDIFIVNYLVYETSMPVTTYKGIVGYGHPRSYEGTPDVLYRNNGDGTFTNISEMAGVTNPVEGRGMAAVAWDYDQDGLPDIYVANDTNRNFLYHNNGDGTFTDESTFIGVGYDERGVAEGSMGVDSADYDGDGWFDLIVANSEKATLYKNEEGLFFFDATADSGLEQPTLPFIGFSPLFLDYDNDGHVDMFCANGNPQDVVELLVDHDTYAQRDQMFQNNGDGTYSDISEAAGDYFSKEFVGRAAATADYDNDGDMDIVIMNSNQRAVLLRNDGGNRKNWLGIKLVGTQNNRDGIGTKVTLTTEDMTQIREVKSGSSYASGSDTRLLFGLGESQHVKKVSIVWQSGTLQELEDISANQILTIVESEE
ncbi:MAG: CRTAC1 family protein [Candidatus Poribacteria bacterium]|nr:CRTAC1 family protein [Candidatus Poribacteria bacterium]